MSRPGSIARRLAALAAGLAVLTADGATAAATDQGPPTPTVREPAGWFSRDATATLTIEPPSAGPPASGIRGYAISVDRDPGRSPCEQSGHCRPEEVGLGSPAGGTVSLPALPEGISLAHVVTVSDSGVHSTVVDVPIRVDGRAPSVELTGHPAGWANRPVRVVATATDLLSGMASAGAVGPFTALRVDDSAPLLSPGHSATAMINGDGTHRVEFYGRDSAGNVGDGKAGYNPPGTAIVRVDSAPPDVAFTNSQDPADPERIEALVADPLSGPAARGTIAVRPARSHRVFEPLATTASAGRLFARWDSASHPPGSYEFRATGYDLAGNEVSVERRANGTRMVLANPLKRSPAISFGFDGGPHIRQEATRQIRVAGEIVARGRVTGPKGKGLGGVPVEIVESFPAGAEARSLTSAVTTTADGGFRVRLSAGPSREVEARFAGTRVLGRTASRTLLLRVGTAVRLRASAGSAVVGGAPVVFSGRVAAAGATVPASGLPVELQFRLAGTGWSEFRTVQTDRRGRFRYPYSFSDDDSRGVRFRFRAYVPPLEGWPYEPAGSRPVFVSGR